ncbi:hypothetical protein FHX82_002457 [Amycolatopsis bartoniae]|uniref:Uncharacterized protein n=1 Tax=Amycolatopsis bartoniae TaxID=941986 RepID=A0A8H9MFY2_9PSEU|nr:hypothetical protein [Amycolatopsis bartoniae]MBB2935403.1 hypothetical protein [Amycolatopsis bartoniae]GHF75833.1 hypothetical protein GCM10017566_57080 [Amycolatopsis bartoniae]
MAQEQEKKRNVDPDPPLTPGFPRLKHPDLDPDQTEDVPKTPPNSEDVQADNPTPEPPD